MELDGVDSHKDASRTCQPKPHRYPCRRRLDLDFAHDQSRLNAANIDPINILAYWDLMRQAFGPTTNFQATVFGLVRTPVHPSHRPYKELLDSPLAASWHSTSCSFRVVLLSLLSVSHSSVYAMISLQILKASLLAAAYMQQATATIQDPSIMKTPPM